MPIGTIQHTQRNPALDLPGTVGNYASTPDSPAVSLAGNNVLRLPGTAGNYASTPDTPLNSLAGNNVLRLPGITGHYASTPDSVATSITGDIDIRVKIMMDDWTPSSIGSMVSKWAAASQRSWDFYVATSGRLVLTSSADGAATVLEQTSTVPGAGWSAGSVRWLRATLDVDNDAGGHNTKFYTSDDGVTWVQEGTTITVAGVTSIFNGTSPVEVGGRQGGGQPVAGTIHYAEIRNGIDGPVVAKFDPSTISPTVDQVPTTLVSSTGETWTMNGTRWNWRRDNEVRSLRLTGGVGVHASTPDSAALSIAGDIDVRVKVALDDWTPATQMTLVSKTNATTLAGYEMQLNTNGTLRLFWLDPTLTVISVNSTVVTGVVDGATKWVRATLDVDNGAVGHDVKFYLSDDGITWVQLGTTVTTASVTSIGDGTSVLQIGARAAGTGTNLLIGNIYYVEVRNNILNDGTGIVANPSFENAPWDVGDTGAATGTDAIGNTWTLNGAAIIQRAFASGLDLRIKVAADDWTSGGYQMLFSKYISYELQLKPSGDLGFRMSGPRGY